MMFLPVVVSVRVQTMLDFLLDFFLLFPATQDETHSMLNSKKVKFRQDTADKPFFILADTDNHR